MYKITPRYNRFEMQQNCLLYVIIIDNKNQFTTGYKNVVSLLELIPFVRVFLTLSSLLLTQHCRLP